MKRLQALFTILLLVAVCAGYAAAQDRQPVSADEAGIPYPSDDADMRIEPKQRSFSTMGIQVGGWLTPVYIDDRNSDAALGTSINTLKVFLKSYLWNNAFIYIRGKEEFSRVVTQDGYDLEPNDNVLDLEAAFIAASSGSGNIRVYLGRKYFTVGTGLVLNGRGDGAEIGLFSSIANLKLFGAYTGLLLKDTNPYGLTSKDESDGAKRLFAGGSLSKDFKNTSARLFGMAQVDLADEDPGVKSRYQSQYYGAVVDTVLMGNISVNGEFVYETGTSYIIGSPDYTEESIAAMAGQLNLTWYGEQKVKPVVTLQYAYGSGDPDRASYTVSNANTSGNDTGFMYFGTYNGGYGLRPRLSNLHAIRGGFSVMPFNGADSPRVRQFQFTAKYSYYMKDKAESPIGSGTDAPFSEKFVGQGIDAGIRWAIFADLSFFGQYGIFLPGNAYATDESNRQFLMAGLNLLF